MAYRHFQFLRNNQSWGAAAYTKKGVLKRGTLPDDAPSGCGTLQPPPPEAADQYKVWVLHYSGGKWNWVGLYYTSAVVPDACEGGTTVVVQSFSPLSTSLDPCGGSRTFQFFGTYPAECGDEENA